MCVLQNIPNIIIIAIKSNSEVMKVRTDFVVSSTLIG